MSAGTNPRWTASDRRNHYRVLHVQPDASFEVIKASYRALMQKLKLHPDLGGDHRTAVHVNAAYAILSDSSKRAAYDRELFASYDIATLSRGPLQPESRSTCGAPGASSNSQRPGWRVAYEPIVTGFCLFCQIPYRANHRALEESGCVACASPLFPPHSHFLDEIRRSLGRSPQDQAIAFYAAWPGPRFSGRLLDLSPTGLRFLTADVCELGDILKIEAQHVQAVGAVAHLHGDRAGTTVGVRFLTVGFRVPSGSFVSARA